MHKKRDFLAGLFVCYSLLIIHCSVSYAMGGTPPPTQEVEAPPTTSEEALAKRQVDNLKNISINSQSVREGYEKFLKDVTSGKKYLYEFNDVAKKKLIKGKIEVEKETLNERDSIEITETNSINIKTEKNSKILLIEIPM